MIFLRIVIVFITCFLLLFSTISIIVNLITLQPGESIGQGWYFMRGYFVEEEMVNGETKITTTISQGSGPINVAFASSVLVTGVYLLWKLISNMTKIKLKNDKDSN